MKEVIMNWQEFYSRISELGEENLGKYLNLNEEELARVAHMEIAW